MIRVELSYNDEVGNSIQIVKEATYSYYHDNIYGQLDVLVEAAKKELTTAMKAGSRVDPS